MPTSKLKSVLIGVASGEVFFVAVVLAVISIAMFNVNISPEVPWFPPLVVAIFVFGVRAIDQKWDIGLKVPDNMPMVPVIGFAIAFYGHNQGHSNITRTFPSWY